MSENNPLIKENIELHERIKQLELENEDLKLFKERILSEYSQTMTMFDDAIYNLESIHFRRKLSNITE